MNINDFIVDRRNMTKGKEEAQIAFVAAVYNYAGAESYEGWADPYSTQNPAHELNGFETGDARMAFFIENHKLIMNFSEEAAAMSGQTALEVFSNISRIIDDYGNQIIFPDSTIETVFIKCDMRHLMANALVDSFICNAVTRSSSVYRIWARS